MARVSTGEAEPPEDAPYHAAAVWATKVGSFAGRHLSLEALVRLWAAESGPWVKRHVFRQDPAGPHTDPTTHRSLLGDGALAAIDRRGGGPAVLTELRRLHRLNPAIALAALCKGVDGLAPYVRVNGLDALRAAADKGRGVILVEPHVGPFALFPVLLAQSAIPVGMVVDPTIRPTDVRGKFFALMLVRLWEQGRLRLIPVPSPTAAIRALDVLRGGAVLIWQPLAFPFMAKTPGTVPIDFLGLKLEVPTAGFRLTRRVGAEYVLAYGELHGEADRPFVDLHFEPLVLPSDVRDATVELYGHVERVVVDHIDQWIPWRYFPDDFAPVMAVASESAIA